MVNYTFVCRFVFKGANGSGWNFSACLETPSEGVLVLFCVLDLVGKTNSSRHDPSVSETKSNSSFSPPGCFKTLNKGVEAALDASDHPIFVVRSGKASIISNKTIQTVFGDGWPAPFGLKLLIQLSDIKLWAQLDSLELK